MAGSAIAGAGLMAARRYYRNWGTTKEECETTLPGDELVPDPAVQTTEGITIEASAREVWPWLKQMGVDRAGMYSYEKLENLAGIKHRNADRIHPEWQDLAVGDTIRLIPRGWMGLRDGVALPVVQMIHPHAIVLRAEPPKLPIDAVWSFHLVSGWEDRCRLLVRTRIKAGPTGAAIGAEAIGPVMALMTRGMLTGIKSRVEQTA